MHKPNRFHGKNKTKKTEIISTIHHVQRSPCLHYHGCASSKFSHENNLHSDEVSWSQPTVAQPTASSPAPTTDSSVSYSLYR